MLIDGYLLDCEQSFNFLWDSRVHAIRQWSGCMTTIRRENEGVSPSEDKIKGQFLKVKQGRK